MKKRYYILIILIIISLIFGTYTFFNQKQQKQNMNRLFIGRLSQARCGFGSDYNKMNNDSKNYNYITIASNLYTALNVLDYTSYNDSKNEPTPKS